jgi:hypothetical protein
MIGNLIDRAISSMHPHEALFWFVGAPIAAAFIMIGIGARVWYLMRVKQWEMSLKHTMLERGMSADEIKAVLEASATGGERKIGCWSHRQRAGNDV